MRESQDPCRDTDHVSEPEKPDISMPDPEPPETPGDIVETSDDDHEAIPKPVAQSSSSHWEWRPEYEVPPPEPHDSVLPRRRLVAKRPPTNRRKRSRSEPDAELCPLTARELSEDVFEILIDLFASPGPEHCEDSRDSRGSEHCRDSRVPEACVYTQDRDRARQLKRCVEVSLRNLTREDSAKQKEWASGLDKEVVELVKDRLKVPRSHILRARWVLTWKNVGTENAPKARLCVLGFQDPHLTKLSTSSPTLTSDGESPILQWIVREGHLVESGDLKRAFLSGDPEHA